MDGWWRGGDDGDGQKRARGLFLSLTGSTWRREGWRHQRGSERKRAVGYLEAAANPGRKEKETRWREKMQEKMARE
jgi:hypothetical protein